MFSWVSRSAHKVRSAVPARRRGESGSRFRDSVLECGSPRRFFASRLRVRFRDEVRSTMIAYNWQLAGISPARPAEYPILPEFRAIKTAFEAVRPPKTTLKNGKAPNSTKKFSPSSRLFSMSYESSKKKKPGFCSV